MNTKNHQKKKGTASVKRLESIIFLLDIVDQLATQLDAVRQEGSWTMCQRFSLWRKSLSYRIASRRLKRLLRRSGDPDRIHIPSRHILVCHAIETPDVASALSSLERRGEYTCCIVPALSKRQKRELYAKARKRGFEVRTERRFCGFFIERLPE